MSAPTQVATSTQSGYGGGAITPTFGVTSGHLLIVAVDHTAGATMAISDTLGGLSWTKVEPSGSNLTIFYATATTTTTGTITVGPSAGYVVFNVLDALVTVVQAAIGARVYTSGNPTVTLPSALTAGNFVVGVHGFSDSTVHSTPTGYTNLTAAANNLNPNYVVQCSYNLAPSSKTISWSSVTAEEQGGALELAPLFVAPNAPTLTAPANSSTFSDASDQTFTWTYSNPNPSDGQSAYDLRYSSDGGATWTTLSGSTPNQFRLIVAGTFADGSYQWQVRTYNSTGLVGPWSSSLFFTVAAPPAGPTITAPTSGSTVGTSTATVTWSVPNQTDYQVRRVADISGSPDTSTVYYDSGDVMSAVVRSISVPFPTNNRYEHVQVRIKYSGLWTAWTDARVDVSYTQPMTPAVTATAINTIGTPVGTNAIEVTWTAPTPTGGAPTTASADVWVEGGPEGTIRIATLQAAAGSYVWETPASGVPCSFQVVAVGTNGVTAASAWT